MKREVEVDRIVRVRVTCGNCGMVLEGTTENAHDMTKCPCGRELFASELMTLMDSLRECRTAPGMMRSVSFLVEDEE